MSGEHLWVTAAVSLHLEVMRCVQGGQRALLDQDEDLAQQVSIASRMCTSRHPATPLSRYPALLGDSRCVIRSNSSVSGSPMSRPNSVSP